MSYRCSVGTNDGAITVKHLLHREGPGGERVGDRHVDGDGLAVADDRHRLLGGSNDAPKLSDSRDRALGPDDQPGDDARSTTPNSTSSE